MKKSTHALFLLTLLFLVACNSPSGDTSGTTSSTDALRGGVPKKPKPTPTPDPTPTPTPAPSPSPLQVDLISTAKRLFYIDFVSGSDSNSGTSKLTPWKRAPGMTNFSGSYTKAAGDVFVFKGGVTWTSSFPWAPHGGSNGVFTGYTADPTWFNGASFAKPIFNGMGLQDHMIYSWRQNHMHFDKLEFRGCHLPFTPNGLHCLRFENASNLNFTNNNFAVEAYATIWLITTEPGTYSNINILGNDFTKTATAIVQGGYMAAPMLVNNVKVNSNTFHDYSSQIGSLPGASDGTHADVAWHGFNIPFDDPGMLTQNVEFCNNRFSGAFTPGYGDKGGVTAFFYQQGGLKDLLICNNDFNHAAPGKFLGQGQIVLYDSGHPNAQNVEIYNNNFADIYATGSSSFSSALYVGGYDNITHMNNIYHWPNFCIQIDPQAAATLKSDYNLFSCSSNQFYDGAYIGFDRWQLAGRDLNSKYGDPLWVSSSDLRAQSALALGTGKNLSSLGRPILNKDITGKDRPLTGNWDMGPYTR